MDTSYKKFSSFAVMNKRPQILVTNDDGITAPGIASLVSVASEFGDVYVVAPDKPQSGMGHAITIHEPIRLIENKVHDGVKASYQCSGTPVDCVKIAVDQILESKPDLCLSGINHGANHSINILYSGTMSAAMEGAIENIPSVGFSLMNLSWDSDFTVARDVVREVLGYMLENKLPEHVLFNVNIPSVAAEDFKGIRIAHQGNAKWQEKFMKRQDPGGRDYYWLTGEFDHKPNSEDSDVLLTRQGYASMVPIKFDLTNYDLIDQMRSEGRFS